jgi:uncharacterized protein (TIGR03118 family)
LERLHPTHHNNLEDELIMARLTLNAPFRVLLLLTAAVILYSNQALAQYTLTSLVTTTQDPHLKNGWGMAYLPTGPFWISDEGTGLSTVYDANGTIVPLVVTIPPASTGTGSPTGMVANSTTGFVITQNGKSAPAAFIFDTLDGTISGWASSVNNGSAVIAVNNGGKANYTGLAIGKVGTQTVLYAANQATNKIEIYDSTFTLRKTFTDTKLTGMTVYGVSFIKNYVVVTFTGGTTGAVDAFSPTGTLVKTLIPPTSVLKEPWGLALAPSNFDTLSNTLLVGNVQDGTINGFSTTTGKLVGTIKDKSGSVISIPGLWAIEFGGGVSANGNTNQLFFAAGTNFYATGEFGVINP